MYWNHCRAQENTCSTYRHLTGAYYETIYHFRCTAATDSTDICSAKTDVNIGNKGSSTPKNVHPGSRYFACGRIKEISFPGSCCIPSSTGHGRIVCWFI